METKLELLQLPEMPQVVYKNPPLALAICQIRYNSILNVANPGFVAPFQDAIQSSYPQTSSFSPQEIQLNIATNQIGFQQGNPPIQWQFSDSDDNWRLVLAPGHFSIETRVYEHFDTFISRLEEALEALLKYIKPTTIHRIGLRYINEIRTVDMRWSDIIQRELLGPTIALELIRNATQISTIQQMQLQYPENQAININHGLFSNGSIVRPGRETLPPNQPFYLLDFDVYREFPAAKVPLTNSAFVIRHAIHYHRAISQLFYWSVTEEYLSSLEVE